MRTTLSTRNSGKPLYTHRFEIPADVSPVVEPGNLSGERTLRLARVLGLAWFAFVTLTFSASAVIPSPEKILPDDTLVLITAPDFAKVRENWKKGTQAQFWNDPAMKPFKEKFTSKWTEDLIKPLERDLGIKLEDYHQLPQGQVTFALRQIGGQGSAEGEPGLLLLIDSRDKSDSLKKNLADLRKKWVDAGKTIRTEKIHDIEFAVLDLSTNDVPKTLRKLFPASSPVQEAGDNNEPSKTSSKSQWVIGQVQSLLVIGNSIKAVEPVVLRLTGGSVPALADLFLYQADQVARFRDAALYAWVNAKTLMDIFSRQMVKKEKPDAPNPFDISPEKIINALGLKNLKTLGASFRSSDQGTLLEAYVGAPESSRQGLLKILAGEPKNANPPAFVPADAVKFQRWRIDGQKAWAALEKMVNDISPQWMSGINFLIETANTAAREKDPGFDIRKSLIGNLGDDVISYQKAPRGNSVASLRSPPSIALIGSPQPEQFAVTLRSLAGFIAQQAGISPEEREFLGRKIYSIPLRSLGLPMPAAASAMPATLSFAASGGYVALSTDASILEEYLRSSETQGKALRETPGLDDAAQKVLGPGSSLFGYQNQTETARTWFEMLRKDSGAATNATAAATAFFPGATEALKDWLDFSLLPPFEKISKYFYFTVYGGSASADGLTFRMFAPVPPALRGQEGSKP
jgi:hypothetical protein